jgi:hypothetical protein
MAALTLLALSLGIVLGLRFKAFPLILAILAIAVYAVAIGVLISSDLASLLLSFCLVSIALQMGFMGGAMARYRYRRSSSAQYLRLERPQ